MRSAQQYWEIMVVGNMEERMKNKKDERKLRNLIESINNLPDWNYDAANASRDFHRVGDYREQICSQNKALALMRDIADGTKHRNLSRRSRAVTSAHQLNKICHTSFDAAPSVDNLSSWDAVEEWVVTDDGGNTVPIEPALKDALAYWSAELV